MMCRIYIFCGRASGLRNLVRAQSCPPHPPPAAYHQRHTAPPLEHSKLGRQERVAAPAHRSGAACTKSRPRPGWQPSASILPPHSCPATDSASLYTRVTRLLQRPEPNRSPGPRSHLYRCCAPLTRSLSSHQMSSPCNERNWPPGTAAAGSASSQQCLARSMQRQQSEPSRSSPKCLQQESIRHGQRWQCMALSSPGCGATRTTALGSDAPYPKLGPGPQKARVPPQQQPAQQHALKGGLSRSKWAGHRHHRIFVHI